MLSSLGMQQAKGLVPRTAGVHLLEHIKTAEVLVPSKLPYTPAWQLPPRVRAPSIHSFCRRSSVCLAMSAPKLVEGPEGQQKVLLQSQSGGSAEVFLHGAHVTSWKSDTGEEQLFMSNKAIYSPPKAIRGGIPICFPQFGVLGPLGQHGFARNSMFEVSQGSSDSVTLSFRPSAEQQKQYPHQFHLLITVNVASNSLQQTLEVKNEGSEPMPFTTAFHTYFLVSDVDTAHVDMGGEGLTFQDNTKGRAESQLSGSSITFQQEFDAIFVGAPDAVKVVDEKEGRKISIKKQNLPDAVCWNPWADKANGMADMGRDQYRVSNLHD